MDVEELAAHMRPAGRFTDPAGSIQLIESGIAVGVQYAAEAAQMRARVLALAIGRVTKQRRWLTAATPGPLIAHIGP